MKLNAYKFYRLHPTAFIFWCICAIVSYAIITEPRAVVVGFAIGLGFSFLVDFVDVVFLNGKPTEIQKVWYSVNGEKQ